MGTIKKACGIKVSVGNTGKECDTSMVATAMLIAVHPSLKFTQADLDNATDWLTEQIHKQKAFPMFGTKAPIRKIENNAEADVTVTLDDGLIVFMRYGVYNRVFSTTSGGFCYAKSLSSFNKSGYNIIEIDQTGQMLVRKNTDGTFSGFIADFMYSPSPVLADFTSTPYMNRMQLSYSPQEIVNNGVIFEGASELLSFMGLIDSEITQAAPATTTKLIVGVQTECAEADLVELFGAAFAHAALFSVTNKATGAAVTITGAAVVGTNVELTGVFASGQTYTVKGTSPEVWLGLDIEGYDASTLGVDITIP